MVYAVIARCPVFGGKVAIFDASKTKTVPGVKQVVQISNGVAVIADNTWNAIRVARRSRWCSMKGASPILPVPASGKCFRIWPKNPAQ